MAKHEYGSNKIIGYVSEHFSTNDLRKANNQVNRTVLHSMIPHRYVSIGHGQVNRTVGALYDTT